MANQNRLINGTDDKITTRLTISFRLQPVPTPRRVLATAFSCVRISKQQRRSRRIWCPPFVRRTGTLRFTIWLFVRHVGGEVSSALAFDQGFVLDDDANAFFTTAENFAQLQVSEPSSQRVDFDRSTGRFAAEEGGFVGVNTIGGPTDGRALSRSAWSCSFCLFASSAEIASRRWASRKAIYS
jgi:hypothetical protein